jgi:hypothetical protein
MKRQQNHHSPCSTMVIAAVSLQTHVGHSNETSTSCCLQVIIAVAFGASLHPTALGGLCTGQATI